MVKSRNMKTIGRTVSHHGVGTALPDEWWAAAGMPNFVLSAIRTANPAVRAQAGGAHAGIVPLAGKKLRIRISVARINHPYVVKVDVLGRQVGCDAAYGVAHTQPLEAGQYRQIYRIHKTR